MGTAKRVFDIIVSLAGLIVLSPVFLAAALAVKLEDGGPVFFLHERVGLGFRLFRVIKFRTMVQGAPGRGPSITAGGDSRVTRVGRVLRRTKLDELPQLVNVLRGEMSIVGPRPEVARYVDAFRSDYEKVLSVRPGITDYASIEYRDEETVLARSSDPERLYMEEVLPTKLRLARRYVDNSGIFEDLRIIIRTVKTVITGV